MRSSNDKQTSVSIKRIRQVNFEMWTSSMLFTN